VVTLGSATTGTFAAQLLEDLLPSAASKRRKAFVARARLLLVASRVKAVAVGKDTNVATRESTLVALAAVRAAQTTAVKQDITVATR